MKIKTSLVHIYYVLDVYAFAELIIIIINHLQQN